MPVMQRTHRRNDRNLRAASAQFVNRAMQRTKAH